MSNPPPVPENTDDQQLVAYLDGELGAVETAALEDRLSSNPELRHRLHQLQKAWDLLDELPRNEATESFTKSTIEMVLDRATLDLTRSRRKTSALLWRALTLFCLFIISGIASFTALNWLRDAPNRRLVRDLPYIENMDLYKKVNYDIDYLRRLDAEDLFSAELLDERQ